MQNKAFAAYHPSDWHIYLVHIYIWLSSFMVDGSVNIQSSHGRYGIWSYFTHDKNRQKQPGGFPIKFPTDAIGYLGGGFKYFDF